jgi:hypothetical protein
MRIGTMGGRGLDWLIDIENVRRKYLFDLIKWKDVEIKFRDFRI